MNISGKGILDLVRNYPNAIGAEIGTRDGETAKWLLQEKSDLTIHSIDPYLDYMDWCGPVTGSNQRLINMLKFIGEHRHRFVQHRMTSDEAVQIFEDNSLDFIFIDGLHTYEQVLKDCQNYYPKIKSGGLFSGHDFRVLPEVNRAVTEFAASIGGIEIRETEIDVWYWFKP